MKNKMLKLEPQHPQGIKCTYMIFIYSGTECSIEVHCFPQILKITDQYGVHEKKKTPKKQ